MRCEERVRRLIQRKAGVRAVIDVGADRLAPAHDETAQGPVALAHREAPRARIVEFVERADHRD